MGEDTFNFQLPLVDHNEVDSCDLCQPAIELGVIELVDYKAFIKILCKMIKFPAKRRPTIAVLIKEFTDILYSISAFSEIESIDSLKSDVDITDIKKNGRRTLNPTSRGSIISNIKEGAKNGAAVGSVSTSLKKSVILIAKDINIKVKS